MENRIAYEQYKDTITQSVMSGSHHYLSLVELFSAMDQRHGVLVDELEKMMKKTDLRISAAELADAYTLVEDVLLIFTQVVSTIGIDEVENTQMYLHSTDLINQAKELAPEINNMIDELLTQIVDFNELFQPYSYSGVDSFNPVYMDDYMKATKKVARISTLVYKRIAAQHESLKPSVSQLTGDYQATAMFMESRDGVRGKYFVAYIPDVALIEVGETEDEALARAKEYFDGEIDDTVKTSPCSHGVYNAFTVMGEIPEEWETVDGVIVLPEEHKAYEDNDSARIDESPKGIIKAAAHRIRYEVETKVEKSFEASFYQIKSSLEDNIYTISIHPDTLIQRTKFSPEDKKVVKIMANKLRDHSWFDEVDVDETPDGILALTMVFGNVDIQDYRLNLNEMVNSKQVSSKILNESEEIVESEELDESAAEGIMKAMVVRIIHEIEEALGSLVTAERLRIGHIRKFTNLIIDVQADRIFGDGRISDEVRTVLQRVAECFKEHPWFRAVRTAFPEYGDGLIEIKLRNWGEVNLKDAVKFEEVMKV